MGRQPAGSAADRWEKSDFGAGAIREWKWVVNQCLQKLCSTSDAMSALLAYGLGETEKYRDADAGSDRKFFLLARLRLLQFKDRLDTFLGIHLGRFSPDKYMIFRSANLLKVASTFAEHGKTGALELLLKRNAYTLAPDILTILDEIPETLSPHTYEQLLPRLTPPQALLPRRGQDWVENQSVLDLIDAAAVSGDVDLRESTEFTVNLSRGLRWPDSAAITSWYLDRARSIDRLSGQLENSLFLLDAGIQRGIGGLDQLWKDVADLCRVSFSNAGDEGSVPLAVWESLDGFNKFKMMLNDVNEDSVVDRLVEVAVPFVQTLDDRGEKQQSFLVRYLREMAATKLRLCAVVLDDASKPPYRGVLFENEEETIAAGLECIYSSSQTDEWDLMSSVLSKFVGEDEKQQKTGDGSGERSLRRGLVNALRYPNKTLSETLIEASADLSLKKRNPAISDELEKRLRVAEGHIQAGKILYQYQLPTKIGFLVTANEDVKATKQMLRILLSKFLRKQPGRSDGEWNALWRDLQVLQEKAFSFIEKDYFLLEFCRGLLKAGKFYLAKSYFRDPGANLLSADRIESLVLQTSREFFYSANTLDSPDIDWAKDCLSLIPDSDSGIAERDLIVAVTERLPELGVTMLPAQFRQIKDPMEVLKMAIESNEQSHVPLEELFEVARLLGFTSPSEMASVEEALAREAAAHGDIDLAQKLCIGLARKDHGSVWDLCAAIGRGPDAEKLDIKFRKEMISFSLRHCDDESIGELLAAWKEFDLVDEYLPVTLLELPDCASAEGSERSEEEEGYDLREDISLDKDDEQVNELEEASSSVMSSPEPVESASTLSARRSRIIAAEEFPDFDLTEPNLSSLDDASNWFSDLAAHTRSKKQAIALKLVLEEWGSVLETEENDDQTLQDEGKVDEDGWGDGWQDIEVAEVSKLHSLWKIACCKLIQHQGLEIALGVLDKSSASSSALLNEDEARELVHCAAQENILSAMKLALLLPYESLKSSYLDLVEAEFRRHPGIALDKAAMTLLVSARLLPTIAGSSDLTNVSSALSKIFGEFLQQSRAGVLLPEDSLGAPSNSVIVPYFVAEMTRARNYAAAASLVLQLMRVPQSFATWNIAQFALKRYLESQQQQQRQIHERGSFDPARLSSSSLFYISETIARMVNGFDAVAAQALAALAEDTK